MAWRTVCPGLVITSVVLLGSWCWCWALGHSAFQQVRDGDEEKIETGDRQAWGSPGSPGSLRQRHRLVQQDSIPAEYIGFPATLLVGPRGSLHETSSGHETALYRFRLYQLPVQAACYAVSPGPEAPCFQGPDLKCLDFWLAGCMHHHSLTSFILINSTLFSGLLTQLPHPPASIGFFSSSLSCFGFLLSSLLACLRLFIPLLSSESHRNADESIAC